MCSIPCLLLVCIRLPSVMQAHNLNGTCPAHNLNGICILHGGIYKFKKNTPVLIRGCMFRY